MTIQIPTKMIETIDKLVRTSRQMFLEIGREPTVEELAERRAMPVEKVRKVLEIARAPINHSPSIMLPPDLDGVLLFVFCLQQPFDGRELADHTANPPPAVHISATVVLLDLDQDVIEILPRILPSRFVGQAEGVFDVIDPRVCHQAPLQAAGPVSRTASQVPNPITTEFFPM